MGQMLILVLLNLLTLNQMVIFSNLLKLRCYFVRKLAQRYSVCTTDGFKITYAIGESVSGTQRGSAITNLTLTTSNTTTSTVAGSDIYRAQMFPSGHGNNTKHIFYLK